MSSRSCTINLDPDINRISFAYKTQPKNLPRIIHPFSDASITLMRSLT